MEDHACDDSCALQRVHGGPPEGILTRFRDMFHEKEELAHRKAAETPVKL